MRHLPTELDSARAILKTYRQVNDTPGNPHRLLRSKLHQKNKALLDEIHLLKEKYMIIKKELMNREERLQHLNRQLSDKSSHMARLQEDFENAIYQLTNTK